MEDRGNYMYMNHFLWGNEDKGKCPSIFFNREKPTKCFMPLCYICIEIQ